MLNLLKLELQSTRFKWANIIVILLTTLNIISVYIYKNAEYNYINELYFITLVFAMFYLGDSEMDKTDLIMNSIPINKKHIVTATYLLILLGFVLSLIYTLIYFWALKIIVFPQSDILTINHIIISLSIYMIHSSVILPIYHISPKTLFYILGIISFYVGRSIVYSNTVAIEGLLIGNKTMNFFFISITLLIISMLISVHNYNKREFARR